MQCRYTGDIGDFAKWGLLRMLSGKGKKLGVAWYLHPDEGHNDDGKHIKYLNEAKIWEPLNKKVFNSLKRIVDSQHRCVAQIEAAKLVPGAAFSHELLSVKTPHAEQREDWRRGWFERVKKDLKDCHIVFADPDNGFCQTNKFDYAGGNDSWKKIPLKEARELWEGNRTAVIYHHNSRFKGGHCAEIKHWMCQLPPGTYAYWCRSYSPRTFFVVNPDDTIVSGLKKFEEGWKQLEKRRGIRLDKRSRLIKPI